MANGSPPRGVLVDENEVFRAGLRDCLESEDVDVIGEAGDPATAWQLLEAEKPDLVLLHSCLPPAGGVPLCEWITREYPEMEVILTDPGPFVANNLGFAQAFLAGARACLPREPLSHEECIAAVRAVLEGRRLLDEEIRLRALRLASLTAREEEVLTLMAQGVPSIKMARALDLATGTVHNYISSVRAKLGVGAGWRRRCMRAVWA
jgi:DNA-binding NarL/FixJ family response regulator